MLYDFTDFVFIVLFNKRWVPFHSQMSFFKEIFDVLVTGRQEAPRAHIYPVALRTTISSSIDCFDHKWLESLVFSCSLIFFLPVRKLPPPISLVMIDRGLFQNIGCNSPYFLINPTASWLEWHVENKWTSYQLRLVGIKEWVGPLYKPSVVPNRIDLIWKILVVLEFLIFFESDRVTVKQVAFVKLYPEARIFSSHIPRSSLLFTDRGRPWC